ncbi:glycosyltransferase family protein [Solitalea lacus]|uniref:glycosyltransferase family protein n=1 Tax=Solitalea lacus TaxID=2911172 RepID=UPI001EDB80FE|nr:glycosyltransferase family protein [Solitalea lacus]UKJ08210.1 glycosyl transferase [Solitalea lacus]
MKILYAIQGTGNGHVSRAKEIIPHLQNFGSLDLLISGTQADINLSQPVQYKLHGFSFVFGKKGGVDHWKTYKIMNLNQLQKDIRTMPLEQYDLIINDFEPVTAWACKLRKLPMVGLSHQSAFLSEKTPRPKHVFPHWEELVLKYYAPVQESVAFHFERYDSFINTPVIRGEIRALEPRNLGHYTVYLPAYADSTLIEHLKQIKDIKWEIFSKHTTKSYSVENVSIKPVNNEDFNQSLAGCEGLLTGGGFEGPAEALFLGKKVLSVPMANQWEQQCNAEALRLIGVPVLTKIDKEFVKNVTEWVYHGKNIPVNYPDETAQIIEHLMATYAQRVVV